MRKEILVTGTILALAFSVPALAQGRGAGAGGGLGAGVGAGVGAGAGAGAGGAAGVNGNFGGRSGASLDAQGRANTNGPNASDRGLGLDRATVRANDRAKLEDRTDVHTNAANELGKLNAAHASAAARQNASAKSSVGEIATYETNMKAALAIKNPTQRTAAITQARQTLAAETNKELTASAVARVDGMLGIQGASPRLGTTH